MCWWNNCKSFNDPTRRELFLKGDSSIFSRGTWRKVRKALIRLWACACVSPMCTGVTMHAFGRGFVSLCLLLCFHSRDSVSVIWYQRNSRQEGNQQHHVSGHLRDKLENKQCYYFSTNDDVIYVNFPQTVFDNPPWKPEAQADSQCSCISSPRQWPVLAYLTNTVLNTMRRWSH